MKDHNVKPLFVFIAEAVRAFHNVQTRQAAGIVSRGEQAGTDWGTIWRDRLEQAARDCLPSGSGFDAGCKIDLDGSRADRITLETAFHHMDAGGGYDGWTTHKVILTPAFGSYAMRVTGKDRNGIKEYVADAVGAALDARVCYDAGDGTPDGFRVVSAPESDRETLEENAACLWEAALAANGQYGATGSASREAAPDWARAMLERWDNWGAVEMRATVCALAGDVESAWKIAQSCGFDSPFDWEFCPWFIAACVDWETGGLVPDWRDRCRTMGDADNTLPGASIAALDAINTSQGESI